jgi:predicted nucleic acid-binding protein
MDHSALALALQERCPLLTGDKDLRVAAKKEGVEVHGTLWIIEELLNQKILKQSQAKGSRLPWGDVEKLLNRWEMIGVSNE